MEKIRKSALRHGQTVLLLPAAAAAGAASPAAATGAASLQNVSFATPKSPRSAPKKCLTLHASATLETEQKIGAQARPNGAAAAVAGSASPAAATGAAGSQQKKCLTSLLKS